MNRARARKLLAPRWALPAAALEPVEITTTINPAELLAAVQTSRSRRHSEVIALIRLVLIADANGLVLRCD
jgi:hypothetical protein